MSLPHCRYGWGHDVGRGYGRSRRWRQGLGPDRLVYVHRVLANARWHCRRFVPGCLDTTLLGNRTCYLRPILPHLLNLDCHRTRNLANVRFARVRR